jgi:hypothetical protein
MMTSEAKLHEIIEKFRGEWETKTDWGIVKVALRPLRIHYGKTKGTPDEMLVVNISFPVLGESVTLRAPVLIELESEAGIAGSEDDLRKYSKRTQIGEQESYIELPMIVVGKERKTKNISIPVNIKVNMKEIPKSF